jgi:hypothetical protein
MSGGGMTVGGTERMPAIQAILEMCRDVAGRACNARQRASELDARLLGGSSSPEKPKPQRQFSGVTGEEEELLRIAKDELADTINTLDVILSEFPPQEVVPASPAKAYAGRPEVR